MPIFTETMFSPIIMNILFPRQIVIILFLAWGHKLIAVMRIYEATNNNRNLKRLFLNLSTNCELNAAKPTYLKYKLRIIT